MDGGLSDPHANFDDIEFGEDVAGDRLGDGLDQVERGRFDDPTGDRMHPPVIDRRGQVVADAGGLEIEDEFDIDIERLGRQPLVLVVAVATLEAHVR